MADTLLSSTHRGRHTLLLRSLFGPRSMVCEVGQVSLFPTPARDAAHSPPAVTILNAKTNSRSISSDYLMAYTGYGDGLVTREKVLVLNSLIYLPRGHIEQMATRNDNTFNTAARFHTDKVC